MYLCTCHLFLYNLNLLLNVGLLIFLIVSYLFLCFSLMKVFEKAGVPAMKAWIPGINFIEWCKIIGRPTWWAALLLIPVVNFFILIGMIIDLVRSFGQYSFGSSLLSSIYAPAYLTWMGNSKDAKYLGPNVPKEEAYNNDLGKALQNKDKDTYNKLKTLSPYRKGELREWAEAIIFAVFAAAFIRMFFIEAYVIPSSSMEGTLKVGDFLFVSKFNYGIRTPMTVVQFPLVHNRFSQAAGGFLGRESYLTEPKLPYFRLPKLEEVQRSTPVVFNWPAGDSIIITAARNFSYPDMVLTEQIPANFRKSSVTVRPIDKKDHYIKRCVGVAGDSLQIKNRQLYINGQPAENPSNLQYLYKVTSKTLFANPVEADRFRKNLSEMGINTDDSNSESGFFNLNEGQVAKIKTMARDVIIEVQEQVTNHPKYLFPHDPSHFANWTLDNFGPIYIPKKGATVTITPENIAPYARIISAYEGNKLDIKNGRVYINDTPSTTYTFKQNYYWMMGDNRHNSEDSRVWGYVPEDHIVGKPLFIWFSTKNGSISNGINWDRIFTRADRK
jgi:signal peptidase I